MMLNKMASHYKDYLNGKCSEDDFRKLLMAQNNRFSGMGLTSDAYDLTSISGNANHTTTTVEPKHLQVHDTSVFEAFAFPRDPEKAKAHKDKIIEVLNKVGFSKLYLEKELRGMEKLFTAYQEGNIDKEFFSLVLKNANELLRSAGLKSDAYDVNTILSISVTSHVEVGSEKSVFDKMANDVPERLKNLSQDDSVTGATTNQKAMTPGLCPATLNAAAKEAGGSSSWIIPKDKKLEVALPEMELARQAAADFIKTQAGVGKLGVDKVNKFLKENGFLIQLDASSVPPDGISAASIMKIAVEWVEQGVRTTIDLHNGNKVKGFKLGDVNEIQEIQHLSNGQDAVQDAVIIPTRTPGVDVILVMSDNAPVSPSALHHQASQILSGLKTSTPKEVKGIIAPIIHFSESGKAEELIGAYTYGADGDIVKVVQALYANSFDMDEKGAKATSAMAIGTTRGGGPRPYVVNGPFIAIIRKEGQIVFTGFMDEKSMESVSKD